MGQTPSRNQQAWAPSSPRRNSHSTSNRPSNSNHAHGHPSSNTSRQPMEQQQGSSGSQVTTPQNNDQNQGETSSLTTELRSDEKRKVPIVLQWGHGGTSVYVTGTFNSWKERLPLRSCGHDFVICINLLPGRYQYKFIVDSEWRFACDQPTMRDELGNINNLVEVVDQYQFTQEAVGSGFFDSGGDDPYSQQPPDEIQLAKEPPSLPPHLQHEEWRSYNSLFPPQHVTMNHLYWLHDRRSEFTMLGFTNRYRHREEELVDKFITVIFYKPTEAAASRRAHRHAAANHQHRSFSVPVEIPGGASGYQPTGSGGGHLDLFNSSSADTASQCTTPHTPQQEEEGRWKWRHSSSGSNDLVPSPTPTPRGPPHPTDPNDFSGDMRSMLGSTYPRMPNSRSAISLD